MFRCINTERLMRNTAYIVSIYKKNLLACAALVCLFAAYAAAQTADGEEQYSTLPQGFQNIALGMDTETVQQALTENALFGYRGERDVSLSPDTQEQLIQTNGGTYSYVRECWFQFKDGALFSMTINLNRDKLDFYSIFTTLCTKYGEPASLTPETCRWQNDAVIMALERPLTLKYTDAAVLADMQGETRAEETAAEQNLNSFLESL